MGRPKGSPNKVSRDVREAAQQYTAAALKTLADICARGESEQARVAAANALLDRGHGKATQVVDATLNLVDKLNVDEQRLFAAALRHLASVEGEDAGGTRPTHH